MKKVISLLVLCPVFLMVTSFLSAPKAKITWLTIEELKTAYKKKPRPILIDVYTSWCGWCKVMDKETYTNENVIKYINKNYYPVKFDAETMDAVEFGGKKYNFNPPYKANDLAIFLTGGRLAYPTTVFLPSIEINPSPIPGYLKPDQLEAPLKFYCEGTKQYKNYNDFMKTFKASW